MTIPGNDDPRPLYAQVRDQLIERIRSGAWKPGQLIPNEFEIAAEFGVSQGTARKAIEALASERLVLRRQGRGTFVLEHTPAHVLFRFFNIQDATDTPITPDSTRVRAEIARANAQERAKLDLATGDSVIRVNRVRTRGDKPFITEVIALPEKLFPGLVDLPVIPNTLYDLFQKSYGILMMRTDDRLSAVAADAGIAEQLGVALGTPLLRIDRTAYALDDTPIEWRCSLCHLENAHYIARTRLSHDSQCQKGMSRMALSMYEASVPVFVQMLGALSGVLDKAQAHATTKKFDPAVLLSARLAPDMLAMSRQVQLACDFAKGPTARLAGVEVPSWPDTEKTVAELQERIKRTLDFVLSFKPAQIDGSEDRDVKISIAGQPVVVKGQPYLTGFVLPNFYFHVTTAYAILRHNGVELGKRDFVGRVPGMG